MAKKKYTPEATVDLLYNQLMSDYKGDAQVEAERQRQKSAEKKASGNSTNSSTSAQNTLQSPSAVSRGASAVGNIYKAPKRKYTTGKTTHGYTTARSFAKDQTTKPSKKQNAFERAGKTALGATQQFIGGHISSAGTALQGTEVTARSIHNQKAESEQDYRLRSRREAEERERRIQDDLRRKEGIDTKDALKWRKSNFGSEVEATAKGYNKGRVYDGAKPVSLNSREEALKRANEGIEGTMSPEALGVKEGVYLKGTEKVYDRPLPKEYPEFDEYSPSQKVIGLGDRFIESGSKKIEEAKEGASRIGKLALDLEANAIQMLGDRTVAFVPVFGQALAMGSLMSRAGGTASYEARQEGMNPDQQYAYALSTSLVEGLSEGIFNSVSAFQSTYGKGMFSLADRVSTRVASSKIVANVFKTEAGRIVAYNLARLGAEGFEEGFEEVVADIVEPALKYAIKKGADPTVQFEGYDPKQIAYDYLVGSLMAGIPGSVETGRNIRMETSQAYRDGMAHADEVIARGLVQGREATGEGATRMPTNSEILARQMQAQQESGLSILPGQTRQLQSEIAKDAYQNAQAFAEKAEEAESQANITPSTGTLTESVEVGTRSTALEKQSIEEAKQVMGAEASEKSAGAVGKVKAGTAKVQDHDTILADPKAREAVEEMTGITLPIKNTEARNVLENLTLSNMIANRDTLRKEVQSDLAEKIAEERKQMNKRGGEMFAEHYDEALQGLQAFGSEAGMIYESVFTRLFADGTIRDANFEDSYDSIVAPLGSTVTSYFTEDFARQIFNEGRIKLESDLAKSVAKSKAISAERAGTVTYLHDTGSRLSSRQKETIEKFAQRTNVAIEFYDGKQEGQDDDSNGWYKDGVIHININSTRKLITVAKHELTHHIKATSPELYRKLEDFVFERWYHKDRKMMEEAIRQKQMDYGDIDVIVAREEIIADASEAFFTDRGAINDVILFSKKLGMAIHDGIRTMLDSFLDVQDTDDLGYKGYGEFLKDLKILKDAQRMWLEALNETVERSRSNTAQATEGTETEAKQSRKEGLVIKDGNARWTDERIDNLIDEYGASNPDYSQAYAVLMNPRDFLKLTLADEKLDEWNEASSSDNPAYSNYFRKLNTEDLKNERQTPFLTIYSNDGFEVQGHEGRHRMRALLEAGVKSVPVVIRDTDTKYTKKPLESMTLSSQDFGYDPVNNGAEIIIKDLVPIKESNRAELVEKFGGEAEVRFSKKDSDGNTLSSEQIEYFKDSKARDENGNLLAVYHGTSKDFTIFDRGQIGRHGSYEGAGFNFTPSETRARGYRNVGNDDSQGGVLAGYVNITHPLSSTSTTFTARQLAEVIRQIDPTGDDIIANYARDTSDYGKPSFIARESLYTARQLLDYHDTDVDIYSDLSASGGNADSLINAFKDMGYDGVIHYSDDGKIKTLITFDSNQFKDIDNLNPTDNPDRRLSRKTENEALPKARTIPKKIKDRLIALGADKLGKGGLKAPVQISVRDLRTLWYDVYGNEEGERLNKVLEDVGNKLQSLAGKYTYVSLADALEGTIHYRVDENGKPTSVVLSCKVKNAEYDINFDFTTICAKRAPLQKVLERFIKTEGKNKGDSLYDELRLDEEGLYTLRSIMEQEGFDVSCIGCFVEQNRYAQQTQSKTVSDDWNSALEEWARDNGIEITEDFDFQNLDIDSLPFSEIQAGFRRYSALMKGKKPTVENKNRALIEAIPYLRKRLNPSDYASIAGQRAMMAMGNGKTNLYNLLKRGQGDSKQSTPFVPYNGEVSLLPESIKGKPLFDYLMGSGGARAQSAADFQIEYIFDYMQLVGDLSARGLPMHMYTKVIECAELLGKCGIKINLSAMCDVDNSVDSEYAGLKKVNGKWVYNISDQSIDYNKAVKLQRQDGYSKNIGIIMVVLSKQHMLKALGDADVRYIIGYHSSKMPAVVAKASNMGNATDYTKLNKTNKLNERGQALFDKAMRMAEGDTDLARYKDALRIFDDLIQQDKANDADVRRGNEYTRYMSGFKNNTADFDVYEDIKTTNDARATADNYLRYCMANDLVPMYFPFAFHENYYKCEVYDYNVYDNVTGEYAPMEAVQNVYPDLNIAEGETDSKKFMARVNKMLKAQNEKNKALEPKYERVERRAIAELSITGNDYMDMDASGIDHAELEHRVDMTEEAVEERRRSIKEKELNAKTIEYQSTIRKLEKNVEGLKAQFKRTNKKPNPVEARRQAGRLIQRHASNMSIHEDVANTLTEIYEMYAKRGAKAFDDIYAIAERTAVEIVNNISEVHFEGQEEYNQIKDYLRDTDIVVSEEMKRNITDFNDFRKSHFGKLKLVNGERSNIDSVYAELSEMFPSQFTDEYVNPADQLNHIADVLDSYEPFYETLDGTSEEMQDYVVAVASDLMETAYNLQKSKTFADKKYDEKVKAVKKAREKALANKKEALSKLRDKYNRRMAEAVRMAKTETRAETEFNIYEKAEKKRRIAQIAKIHKRLTEKLLTPSDTKHLPDGYNKIVAEVLGMFDFTTRGMVRWVGRYAVPSERMTAMLNLRRALQEYTTNEEESEIEIDKDMVDVVDILEGAFGEDIKVSDLNLETLENVVVMLRGFEHQINSYNRAFDENNKQRISDLADKVVDEASKVKHGKWRAGIMGRVFTSNLNPWDFFQMIGGEVGSLYEATRKGFDKYENNLRVAKNFMADLIGSRQYGKWANHTKTYKTTSGEEITLTDTQLMSLYCLSKREQAQGHIYGQGVVSAPVKVKRHMIAEQLDKKRVIPTFDDVVDWTKNLSKEQIEVADKIQNFLSNEVAEWGNETSLKLYGYKKFAEKDYFPIQSSNDYLNSNFDAKGSDPTLKNISPTKAVVKGANNPLMLDDIFSIFSKHVAQMASYNGFVPAITDFQRVWNHKMVSADGRKTTVKETFGEAYGDRIAKYVEQFYADLNGVYKRNLDVTTPEKLFGTFKKSAVGGNLRVLAQQPMAIARAMLLVDPALLTVSVPKTALQAKRTYQEMLEHCPIAEWKVWGFYSPDVMGASRDLKNVMLGKDSISDKVFMNMYGVADNITWTVIFNACKMQVERQNKGIAKGSQEYWDKVNDLASDVYDATQVVDSPFHRSELMKSQDGIHKMATAFMAEPTKTVNMINTQLTLCAREISEGKVGKATLRFTRLTGTVLANAMLLAVGQSLIDAMRSAGGGDDDDDKGDFEERFKKHWVTNTKDNLNLLKMLPYVKDAVSIYEGFGVTRMDMNGVEKAVKATQNLKKYYDDPGSAKYTELELWNNTAMAFAYTLGVPISNAKRDLDALALTVAESVKDPKVMLWYMKNKYQVNSKTKSIWADAYYDALDKGNTGLAKSIYAYMKKSGVDDKYIQNREKTWEKHRYGETDEE